MDIVEYVIQKSGSRVQSGPFSGMKLLQRSSWSPMDLPSRLLGTYEQELHRFILSGRSRDYTKIVDIGCADGYYAVGMALLFPRASVYAFDISSEAQKLTLEVAAINGVADRVIVAGECNPDVLMRLLGQHQAALVICDGEGCELDLFSDAKTLRAVAKADVLIECHDFMRPGTTEQICSLFQNSHTINIAQSAGRNPNEFAILHSIPEAERWAAVCEYRPCAMKWVMGLHQGT